MQLLKILRTLTMNETRQNLLVFFSNLFVQYKHICNCPLQIFFLLREKKNMKEDNRKKTQTKIQTFLLLLIIFSSNVGHNVCASNNTTCVLVARTYTFRNTLCRTQHDTHTRRAEKETNNIEDDARN